MGTVFRAVDIQTGASVAVKQIRRRERSLDTRSNDRALERIRREAEALKRLDHPNIVRVHAFAYEADQAQIVMDFVGGGSLGDLLATEDAPIPVERLINISLDLCDALTRSHRLEIIHRDIKPSNVLIANDGTPRLSDFGIAFFKRRDRITEERALVGTVEYLSPEVLAGDDPDAPSDIWALGVMMFEMLTRTHPFARDSLGQTLSAVASSPPPDLELLRQDCPSALVDLIYRMLAKSTSERVRSIRQVGTELESILNGELSCRAQPTRRRTNCRSPRQIVANNIPLLTSTLVGRRSELDGLQQLLELPNVRLITIVAPGGMGKTRLALELAHGLVAGAPITGADGETSRVIDGVFLVQLASLATSDFIVPAITEALRLQFHGDRNALLQLVDYLQNKNLLLIMDSFEHLLEGAYIIDELLRSAAGLTVIATSRERLGFTGEVLFPLNGLPLPHSCSIDAVAKVSSVGLFLQIARNLKGNFQITPDNAGDIVRICELVEGVPLGIILAASWASTLSPREIANEIGNGLDFLSTELRDLPERQRSMRAAFEHSWSMLSEAERNVLLGLSVFRGGFTRDAAQAVLDATVRSLTALCNKSLLRRDPNGGRYEMHELLRQFAELKLAELPAHRQQTLERFGAHFTTHVSTRVEAMRSPNPHAALCEIEVELDNVRATWSYLLSTQRLDQLAELVDGLELFHTRRAAHAEGEAAFGALVQCLRAMLGGSAALNCVGTTVNPETVTRLLGKALALQATFLRQRGHYHEAIALLREALDVLGDDDFQRERAFALVALGSAEGKVGKLHEATAYAEEGIARYRSTSDSWGLAVALESLGWLYGIEGHLAKAEKVYGESATMQLASGHLPSAWMGLGTVMADQGRYEQGCQLLQRVLSQFEAAGDHWNKLRCQNSLANAQRKLGNYAAAEALALDCLAFSRKIGNRDHETWSNFQLGNVLKEQGRIDEAAVHIGAAHVRSSEIGDLAKISLAELEFGDLAFLRGDYSEAELRMSNSLSGFEDSGQTWGVVLALDGLGYLACHQCRWHVSRMYFARTLRLALESRMLPFATNIAAGIALLLARTGYERSAAELLALAKHHSATERHTVTRRIAPLFAELHAKLSPETLATAMEQGRKGSLFEIAIPLMESVPSWTSPRGGSVQPLPQKLAT